MKAIHVVKVLVVSMTLCAGSAPAQEPLDLTPDKLATFEFDDVKLGGFERKKLSRDLRLRGWKVGNGIYFGQTKVAKKWAWVSSMRVAIRSTDSTIVASRS